METNQQTTIPRWIWKLIARLGKLEGGQVYRFTLIVPAAADEEPTWAIEASARLENGR